MVYCTLTLSIPRVMILIHAESDDINSCRRWNVGVVHADVCVIISWRAIGAQLSLLIFHPMLHFSPKCFMMNLHISALRGDTYYWEALDLCLHFLSAVIASRWEVFLVLAWECLLKLFSYWYSWFDTYQIWQNKDLMFGIILQEKHK